MNDSLHSIYADAIQRHDTEIHALTNEQVRILEMVKYHDKQLARMDQTFGRVTALLAGILLTSIGGLIMFILTLFSTHIF